MTIPYVERAKENHSERNGQVRTFRYNSKRVDWLELTGCPSQEKEPKPIPSL